MQTGLYPSHQAQLSIACFLIVVYFSSTGCRTTPDPYPIPGGRGGEVAANGSAGTGGSVYDSGPCTPAVSGARVHPGNFDYESCDVCHTDLVGGWLYTDTTGENWVAEATVTINNFDGTTLSGVTASDGFFSLIGKAEMDRNKTVSYSVCVSKCPNTICTKNTHTSNDCQNTACHGGNSPRIYLPQNNSGANAGSGGAGGCADLPSGGPKAHIGNTSYDGQACWVCHGKGIYTGGFLYDGVTSNTTVARATITLTPANGSPLTAVTGPGGMFYFPGTISAPYTTCVSKCDQKVCSADGTHPTADDCRTCHDETNRIHLP